MTNSAKPKMDRLGKLLGQSKIASRCLTPEMLAVAHWPEAAGKIIRRHSKALKLVGGRLVVEVEDAIWQRQLTQLRGAILSRFDKVAGPGLVNDLEFRVSRVLARKMPVMETRAVGDEADAIADPVFRKIYKASRRKA
jgi:predicted nucleic acid-binding Zn ribbon protein